MCALSWVSFNNTFKKNKKMNTTDLKSLHYLENGQVMFSYFDTVNSTKTLRPGFYELSYNDNKREVEVKISSNKEEIKIHAFPDKEKLDALFTAFFDKRVLEKIEGLGFNHKVGVLFYGKEGTGKSTIVRYYSNKAIEENKALVFYFGPSYKIYCWEFIRSVRLIQNNPIVVIMEEMDQHLHNGGESIVKTILDGNLSINNCIFFGTTNYIKDIPDALKNRPSRFKYSLDIEGIQNPEDIYKLLSKMIQELFLDEEIKEFSNQLKGSTLDQIKQFALDKLMDLKTYNNQRKKIGFFN